MESAAASQNVELNSVSVDHLSTESPEEESCFCCWCVKICECINYLRKSLHEWWIKQALYIWWVDRSYKKTLKAYNVSHVLEKTAGEDNTLGQGNFGKVERYKMTTEDTSKAKVKKPVYSTNDNENEEPVSHYYAPKLHQQEIAYKTVDGSKALAGVFKEVMGKSGVSEEAKYFHSQEKKALATLDHPNIIKPVIVEGDTWQAKKMAVIAVQSLSEEEKQDLALSDEEKKALAAAIAESKGIPNDGNIDVNIDFEFEYVESVKTKPSGIPLPLADSTLKDKMTAGGLSTKEKDNVARAMIRAVAYTHQRGYVHLDINPNNILKKNNDWLLSDWGCAHHYSEMYEGSMDFIPVYVNNGPRLFFGTPNYFSPQMHARLSLNTLSAYQIPSATEAIKTGNRQYPHFETDARAVDAYSLGIVLFELLTGVNPTPSDIKDKPLHKIGDIFQQNVNRLLREHKESLGGYYDIVASLLQSKCRDRMTVPTAESRLSQVPIPQ
ncbi:protein kinase domain-containing protein [Kistimonas asteriae]|uniref:protein kinase domain-containing protein n=1 Tax=Kistimonas asteriae TaxID=517724 RepID=UPI001BAA7829|nr:hypothetical protein [Kistimonas asteriae]